MLNNIKVFFLMVDNLIEITTKIRLPQGSEQSDIQEL